MKKSVTLCLSILLMLAWPALSYAQLYVQQVIPYHDADRIDNRITSECNQLGERFSAYITQYADRNGVNVVRTGGDLASFPNHVEIEIESAISSGNAFMGHAKGISVYAVLYRNGKVVDKTTFFRSSNGGFMGGFKSSCSVLNRTVKALGKDIAQWLARHDK